MACSFITTGRTEPCKDTIGGIKAIYFAAYSKNLKDSNYTFANGELDNIGLAADNASAHTFFKFDLRGANNFEETNEVSRDNGTSFWTGTATIQLKKQDAKTKQELKLLTYNNPHVVLEGFDGNLYLMGAEHGCDVTLGSSSGTAFGDFNGYNITVTAIESDPIAHISATIWDDSTHTSVSATQEAV